MAVNVDKFKKAILAEQDRLLADKARLANHEDNGQSTGELVDFDANHPGDAGTELFERSKDEALHENIGGLLSQIDEALAKIDKGTYGTCDKCGGPIAEARLDALPYATLCIKCQERAEQQ
jgi:RNA polymerase-binding protein DksA